MSQLNVRPALSRARLLGGCSVLGLSLWMAYPTFAQERRDPPLADSFYERFHVSLEGGWLTNASEDNFGFAGALAAAGALPPGARDGNSLGIEVGGAFNPLYDWRAKWQNNILHTAVGSGTSSDGADSAMASDALHFYTFDGEIGYRPPGTLLRLFAGARLLKADNTINYSYGQQDKYGTTTGQGSHDTQVFGIGPRAGLELTVPFPEPRAFASLNGSVAAIFTRREDMVYGSETVSYPVTSTTTTTQDLSRNVTVFNAESTAMLGYRLTDKAAFELGYRVQYFNNMVPVISQVNVGNPAGAITGSSDVLVHGPVAKLTIGLP